MSCAIFEEAALSRKLNSKSLFTYEELLLQCYDVCCWQCLLPSIYLCRSLFLSFPVETSCWVNVRVEVLKNQYLTIRARRIALGNTCTHTDIQMDSHAHARTHTHTRALLYRLMHGKSSRHTHTHTALHRSEPLDC